MQKKIIALAIGLASTSAFAQSSVTIYGVADAAIVYSDKNAGLAANGGPGVEKHGRDTLSVNSGVLGGSRLGFKGTEDIGNGLKAIFVLEYGLDLVNDAGVGANPIGATTNSLRAGTASARQQLVGLSGNFGTASFGRQYAPGYWASTNTAGYYSDINPRKLTQTFLASTISGNSTARWDNSINYQSPTLANFNAQVIYQAGGQANEISSRESYGIGLNYAAGPLVVNYVYQNSKALTTAASGVLGLSTVSTMDGLRMEEHFLGGSFDFELAKIYASVQTMDIGDKAAAKNGNKAFAYSIGLAVPVGKGSLVGSYALADKNSNPRGPAAGAYQGQLESVAINYLHNLSKRTILYTGVIYSDDNTRNDATRGITTTFAAGINHTF